MRSSDRQPMTTARAADDTLGLIEPRQWYLPHWSMSGQWIRLSRWAMKHRDIIRQAQIDGIEHVAPICVAFGMPPHMVRDRIGKGLWKRVHASKLKHNAHRGHLKLTTRLDFATIMDIPTGALNEAHGMIKRRDEQAFAVAVKMSKTRAELRHILHIAADCQRMGIQINPQWSERRLTEEHDRQARAWARRSASPTPWAEPWSCEVNGYTFTRLVSDADYAEEGQIMRHCVASYASGGRSGRETTFRITGAHRATVSFARNGHIEIKGKFNSPVPATCLVAAKGAWDAFRKDTQDRKQAAQSTEDGLL